MKILSVESLAIPEIKVIRYGKFVDHRGFFTEHFRESEFANLNFMKGIVFSQCNESYSKQGTIRGLHLQWNPYMGKLVRTLSGHMTDLVLDIRKGSPTFGSIIGYDMPALVHDEFGEWIWVPPGFAHGNYYKEEAYIEYFCSGEYSPDCEAGISPLADDINWSLFDPGLKEEFDAIASNKPLMTEKDRNGYSIASWSGNPDSERFLAG